MDPLNNKESSKIVLLSVGLLMIATASRGYMIADPSDKFSQDQFLTDAFLRDVVERMERELSEANNYPQFPSDTRQLSLMARANKDLESEQLDYDSLLDGNPHPSLRDQEFLQHSSSLWGHKLGNSGVDNNLVPLRGPKTDAVLPAYCNPPNPCPVGYTTDQGCITQFENTAAFSREWQAAQRCMCDGEHMFECNEQTAPVDVGSLLAFHASEDHKNLVAKKFHGSENENPYLSGEKLPIAAKKGIHVNVYDTK